MKTTFPAPLTLRALAPAEVAAARSGAQLYQLTEDFPCHSARYGRVTVPAGTVTDFASIPRLALAVIDDDAPEILFPSVVHDYLYTVQGITPDAYLTREQADDLLRETMLACGARPWLAALVYRAVRIGGSGHWQSAA